MKREQVHVSGSRGGVVIHVGRKSAFISTSAADVLALELVRKADVARLVERLATSGRTRR